MKKIYLLMFAILFISLASATSTTWGTYKQNDCVNLITICPLDSCNVTTLQAITYPNSTIAISDVSATHTGTVWNYTYCNTDSLGIYTIYGYSTNSTQNESLIGDFEITHTGGNLTSAKSTLYAILIFVFIFFMFGLFFIIKSLPNENQKDEEGKIMSITWLKYLRSPLWFIEWILFVGILFMSSNLAFAFLYTKLFSNILFILFRICFGLTPVILIIWIMWIFAKIYQDKQFQKLINRGIFPRDHQL